MVPEGMEKRDGREMPPDSTHVYVESPESLTVHWRHMILKLFHVCVFKIYYHSTCISIKLHSKTYTMRV